MSETTNNKMAELKLDDGIATVTLRMPKVNKINDDFGRTMTEALAWLRSKPDLRGVIIASGHKDFCVGADLDRLYEARDPAKMLEELKALGGVFRQLETLGVPVVAALTGSALGGGYELALACHRRIAIDDPRIQIGLPEVTLGLIPGAGGTQRLPRLVGIQVALEHIVQGSMLRAPKAKAVGFVDELVPDANALHEAARRYIESVPKGKAKQPWDAGKPIPGPQPNSPDARNLFMAACGMLRNKTAGAYPAPETAISAVQEGLQLTFERALEVEMRYFAKLATSDQAKDMVRTLWFHRTAAEKQEGLPHTEAMDIKKIAILGAGMMGAGLGFVCAKAGFEVYLKDIGQEALQRGLDHVAAEVAKLKHLSAEERQVIQNRVKGTLEVADLKGCDLVIEAVFENLELKHKVTRETEPMLAENGIWASNTSALPIADLAKVSRDPSAFIGLHYFSPVEKMQLVEIITPPGTSERTLARCLAFTRAIKKLPIVVGDGYGFYTTRVFSAYILEGAQLVAEGHDPVLIEWAARQAGMVVPPLQVFDEVTLTLGVKAFAMGRQYGRTLDLPGVRLVEKMVTTLGRQGRAAGQGFYAYEQGRRRGLWPELRSHAEGSPGETGVPLLAQRLMYIQALEAARCVDEGIVKQYRDAEVGAVFGIGFAPNTGGPLAFIDRIGIGRFVEACDALAERYGERYSPPQLLRTMAAEGRRFYP